MDFALCSFGNKNRGLHGIGFAGDGMARRTARQPQVRANDDGRRRCVQLAMVARLVFRAAGIFMFSSARLG